MARTDDEKQKFLDELAICGVITTAALRAQVTTRAVRDWRAKDPQFAEGFADAMEQAADALEAEARRRAHDGVERERVIGSGENARFITEYQYSDQLLMFLLKGAKPDKFAERSKSEVSGPDGGPLTPAACDASSAARLAAIFEEARLRKARAEGNPDPADSPDPFS